MKRKFLSITISLAIVAMAFLPVVPLVGASGHVYTHNTVTIDGMVGADWMDGNYTVREDPDPTSWGDEWQLDNLYFALDADGIYIALEALSAGPYQNHFNVFIDVDQGATGYSDNYRDTDLAPGKDLLFPGTFTPNFMLYGSDDSTNYLPWVLYNYTDNTLDDLSAENNFDSAVYNDTAYSGPGHFITHECFINWTSVYPEGIPANAEIRLYAAMIGGEPGDSIPNQYIDDGDADTYDTWVAIPVSNDIGEPMLMDVYIGWPGANADLSYTSASLNDQDGDLIAGLSAEWYYEVWFAKNGTTFHDYMNTTDWPILHLKHYNSSSDTNTTHELQMWHQAGDYAGGNDIFRYEIPLTVDNGYQPGDIFWWYITAGDLNESTVDHFENKIVSPPPIHIGFVGNVVPGGGFVEPDAAFDITAQVEQLWNGTDGDPVQFDIFTDAYVNYTVNDTETWAQVDMDFVGSAGDRNVEFEATMPSFANGTELTFYINVTNNNTVIAGPYNLIVIPEPPFEEVFYMEDPRGDEWGTYPTNPAFGGLEMGLFDIWEFNVSAHDYGTQYAFRLNTTNNPGWGGGNFSHQCFVVAIDIMDGGSTESIQASNINMHPDYAWDYAFYADGFLQRFFTPDTLENSLQSGHGMLSSYEMVDGEHWFSFYVPKTLFGMNANATWKYYVMSGSGDFNDFRDHVETRGEWAFGGGSDGSFDPRYTDILVPVYSANETAVEVQNYISTSYNEAEGEYGVMLPVGGGFTYAADTTDPTVSITAPADGDTFDWTSGDSYSFTVTWTASDPAEGTFSGLKSVKVYLDAVLMPEATGGSAELSVTEGGDHVIRIVAEDDTGNTAVAEITITVNDNRPTETTTTDDGGFQIPGYGVGFLLISLVATATFLLKKKN